MKKIYLIGSLRNPEVPVLANQLRELGFDVFDDWFAAGPDADDCWRDYEKARGHSFDQALRGYAAQHVFQFDLHHLNDSDLGVLLLPAGKSCHIEAGYLVGQGKRVYVLADKDPERFDVQYAFFDGVYLEREKLFAALKEFLDDVKELLDDVDDSTQEEMRTQEARGDRHSANGRGVSPLPPLVAGGVPGVRKT